MNVYAVGDALWLKCQGCGETRPVPNGCAVRTLTMHVNRFKREHAQRCEVRAELDRDFAKAGRVAEKIVGQFTRGRA